MMSTCIEENIKTAVQANLRIILEEVHRPMFKLGHIVFHENFSGTYSRCEKSLLRGVQRIYLTEELYCWRNRIGLERHL